MTANTIVSTPDGPGELLIDPATEPRAVLVLGHGAGSDVTGWDLALLARDLPPLGVTVARYRQPHRVAGRKLPGSTASLDRGWAPALAAVAELCPELPLFAGGHSAGARTACRGAGVDAGIVVSGVVALSFPLHPPGQPARTRVAELANASAPVLVVQGTRDSFGTPAELRAALGERPDGVRLVEVPDATHPLAPPKSADAAAVQAREDLVVAAVHGFIEELLA